MQVRFLLILFSFSLPLNLLAQENFYSFLTDKKFNSPEDLIGYNFVPNEMEIPSEGKEELGPGEYSFGISRNNLYVAGESMQGVYSINNFNTTEYGYKLTLINARDPRQQGHLKVILVGPNYVDALVFKKSTNEKEIIFFLPQMNDEMAAEDKAFFTDRTEIEVMAADSIWGTKVYPFFRIYDNGNIHERLQYKDSTWISFVEEIEIIEKIKETKKPKVKKEKKKKKKGDFNIETGMYETEESEQEISDELESEDDMVEDELEEAIEIDQDTLMPKVKTKIIKKYFIDLHTKNTNKEGNTETINQRFSIKKIKEREDEQAELKQERFQIEFETNKGLMYLYLTGNRRISSVEMIGEKYLMRGH